MGTTMKTNAGGSEYRWLRAAICAGGIIVAALVAAAGDDPLARGDDVGVYEDFAAVGVFDPEMANEQANEMVSRGVFSPNPTLVRLTLQALASHSRGQRFGTVVDRDFFRVPQLKEFLIEHWHRSIAAGGLHREISEDDSLGRKLETDDPNFLFLYGISTSADWVLIPSILVAVFPGDEDVHDLLWEYDSLSQDVPLDGWILGFFNEGRFKTPEVDRLRIDSVGNENRATAVLAAEGLALSKPEGGLEALISARLEYPDREDILAPAIVAYGPEAIPLLDEAGLRNISEKITRP